MSNRTIGGNLLVWKIIAVFSCLLIVLGVLFVRVATQLSRSYYTMAHQQLYGDVAAHLASFTQPFKNGIPDTLVTHDIIHSAMVANPCVEVYLLDTDGRIVDYVVPDKAVKKHSVDIDKVKQWLAVQAGERPSGDNPKMPGQSSIFSAAPVYENGGLVGYVYAVLSSEKQRKVFHTLNNELYYRLAGHIISLALLVTFIVGVVTFFLITGSVRKIASVVRRFQGGDYTARIEHPLKGNLGVLGSAFNEMADVIVKNIEQVKASDKFRQELIANISHDLRTPLSVIQGYIETLLLKKDSLREAERNKYLLVIMESSRRLSGLVEQLFQYAKLEARQVQPEKEWFPLSELASDILMAYQLKAKERAIELTLHTKNELFPVFADIALTERVLQNLLDNAFKFTPDGGKIAIELSRSLKGIQVKITDTGIGIAPADQAYIFERHKQLHQHQSSQKGMGIGLALVKKILELHEACIYVSSSPGQGTSFWFELPSRQKGK